MQEYPITTVGALILNEEGALLLIKTHKWQHRYGLPGGKIEMGESAEAALLREIKEETNLDVESIEFLLYQDCIYSEEFYKPKHFIFLNFQCQAIAPIHVVLNEEAQEYLWIMPEEALNFNLNSPTRLLIETYLEKNAYIQSKNSLNHR